VAVAPKIQHPAAVHEAVVNGAGHGGLAEAFVPVLHYPFGGQYEETAQLVALMLDRLQYLCGVLGDAPRQEQIVQDWQARRDPLLEQLGLFGLTNRRVAGQLGVGLQVAHVISMQRCLVDHGHNHPHGQLALVPDRPITRALTPSPMNLRMCSSKQATRALVLKRQSKSASVTYLVQN